MSNLCKQYELKGYCVMGQDCPYKHGNDFIQLDVSDYVGLVEASQKAILSSKVQENNLKRKQTDLLRYLIGQQKALIERIEMCSDEAEKLRLKTALEVMSQKTKDWIEAQQQQKQQQQQPNNCQPSTSTKI